MSKAGRIELAWEGEETVAACRDAMKRGAEVEIGLAVGLHHALFRHLHPDDARGMPEDLEEEGGPQLLRRIAAVAGLEELARLERPAKLARYRVRLVSPDPRVLLVRRRASGAKKSGSTALAKSRGWRPK